MRPIPKTLAGVGAAVVLLWTVCPGHSFGQTTSATQTSAVENQSESEVVSPDAPAAAVVTLSFSNSRSHAGFGAGDDNSLPEVELQSSDHSATVPVTAEERLHRFLQNSFSSAALGGNLLDAAQAQLHKAWPGYGRGFDGFQRRYFAVSAGHIGNNLFGTYLFPTLLHQNPRSPRLGPGSSVWRRLGYAVSRPVLTYDDRGKQTVNLSLLLTTVASSSVTNLYYPRGQCGVAQTVSRIEGSLIGNVQGNLTREFLPDIEQFLWKHAPSGLKRLTRRLPFSKRWQPVEFSEVLEK
jgi:hypothetical protein